jgi:hypothetical protein
LSRKELLARLAIIDAEGWDSPAGTDLLRYVLRTVVRSCVRLSGLRGRDAVEAEATAWAAAWESLAGDYLRHTEAPTAASPLPRASRGSWWCRDLPLRDGWR